MKNLSVSTALVAIAVFFIMGFAIYYLANKVKEQQIENKRVTTNFQNLRRGIVHYRTADSLKAARIGVLTMRIGELEVYVENLKNGLKSMGIRAKDVEQISMQSIESAYSLIETLKDSIKYLANAKTGQIDTVKIKYARYEDKWLSFYQEQTGDTINTQIKTRDSITIVQHWERYKFWFIRWGKKNNYETIVSHNPHSEVKCALSIKIDE